MTYIMESLYEQAVLHDQFDGIQGLNALRHLTQHFSDPLHT